MNGARALRRASRAWAEASRLTRTAQIEMRPALSLPGSLLTMNNIMTAAVAASALGLLSSAVSDEEPPPTVPTYTRDGGLKMPEHYREWVYLSTGST
jgi:hypothetical protein